MLAPDECDSAVSCIYSPITSRFGASRLLLPVIVGDSIEPYPEVYYYYYYYYFITVLTFIIGYVATTRSTRRRQL